MIGKPCDHAVALCDNRYHRTSAGFHLLDVRYYLFMHLIIRGYYYSRQLMVYKRYRPVFHFRGRITLGMYIAYLL